MRGYLFISQKTYIIIFILFPVSFFPQLVFLHALVPIALDSFQYLSKVTFQYINSLAECCSLNSHLPVLLKSKRGGKKISLHCLGEPCEQSGPISPSLQWRWVLKGSGPKDTALPKLSERSTGCEGPTSSVVSIASPHSNSMPMLRSIPVEQWDSTVSLVIYNRISFFCVNLHLFME